MATDKYVISLSPSEPVREEIDIGITTGI